LPGAPFESFYLSGAEASNQATVDLDPAGLGAGPVGKTASATVPLPAGCARLTGDFENPCSESLTWTGTVVVTRAGD
jgi:hypothetical protein